MVSHEATHQLAALMFVVHSLSSGAFEYIQKSEPSDDGCFSDIVEFQRNLMVRFGEVDHPEKGRAM